MGREGRGEGWVGIRVKHYGVPWPVLHVWVRILLEGATEKHVLLTPVLQWDMEDD